MTSTVVIPAEPGAQVFHFRQRLGIGAEALRLLDRLGEFLLQFRFVGRFVKAECLRHLRQQILVEELRHLGTLGVHDPVEAEIQIGLVELEELLQQGFQLLKFLAHYASRFCLSLWPGGSNDLPSDSEEGLGFRLLREASLQLVD